MKRCYVASALGFNEPGREYYQQVVLPSLEGRVEVIDPWAHVDDADVAAAAADGTLREYWLRVAESNTQALQACDLLVAVLDGQELDSGTAAEIGYAAALGVTCFGLRSDLRRAGEHGMRVNLQVEGFVVQSGGAIVSSLDELLATLDTYLATPGRSGELLSGAGGPLVAGE
jgi:nucleoside 2-deoxyribosyltransferase